MCLFFYKDRGSWHNVWVLNSMKSLLIRMWGITANVVI